MAEQDQPGIAPEETAGQAEGGTVPQDLGFGDTIKARARYHARQVIDHLWGPTGSVILHVLLVVALVRLVTFNTRTREPEIEVMMVEPDAADLEEFDQELEQLQEQPPDIRPPDANITLEQPPEIDTFSQEQPDQDLAALDIRSDVQSPLIMKGLFSGRSAGARGRLLQRFAGRYGTATEAAVNRALEWLKKHQEADGSWKATTGQATAMTGLGLLTFLAHGETPSSERYGPTVEKAIRFLVDNVRSNGDFKSGGGGGYGHGMAAYALAEAYALTRIPSVKPAVERAVQRIVKGQEANGGFNYNLPGTSGRADSSVMGGRSRP